MSTMTTPAARPARGSFVRVPGGTFLMGGDEGQADERPVHEVRLEPFEMAVYPVTQAEYAEFLHATGNPHPRDWPLSIDADLPVTGVSWFDAQAYCDWRTRCGDRVRLPTEAEWERAARGGHDGLRYPWGDAIPDWIPHGGRGPLSGAWPVTLGAANGFGLYGIGANVHEWCEDWHAPDYYACSPLENPKGPLAGIRRVSRGGAWRHAVTISRCAARSKIDPAFRYTDYSFRVVR